MTMPGKSLNILIKNNSNVFISFRVNLPSGEGDNSDGNSSDELESVVESESDHHIGFVSRISIGSD